MATFNKKEREKKKAKKKKDKEMKKMERKESSPGGGLDAMMAYVDENGNLVDTPPDPSKKKEIKAEDIDLSQTRTVEEEDTTTEKLGKVDYYNNDKGYGFIKDANSEERYFFHVNAVSGALVNSGDRVSYSLEKGPKGMVAVGVSKKH
ncbi:MAG: cold shock domain-containing protein [Crocinitomicaceae bacterium]|nr:cold shock domain-containing protein [Crocinitomicaceae bacterium]